MRQLQCEFGTGSLARAVGIFESVCRWRAITHIMGAVIAFATGAIRASSTGPPTATFWSSRALHNRHGWAT
jgi:hypothetical protein